jgi:hypothetical protein
MITSSAASGIANTTTSTRRGIEIHRRGIEIH